MFICFNPKNINIFPILSIYVYYLFLFKILIKYLYFIFVFLYLKYYLNIYILLSYLFNYLQLLVFFDICVVICSCSSCHHSVSSYIVLVDFAHYHHLCRMACCTFSQDILLSSWLLGHSTLGGWLLHILQTLLSSHQKSVMSTIL